MNAAERTILKRRVSEIRLQRLRVPGRCWWCFDEFEGRSRHQRYCSKGCRERAYIYRRAGKAA